jgi:hypothetical protein
MTTPPVDTAEIAGQLARCAEDLDEADRRVQLALFRLLPRASRSSRRVSPPTSASSGRT